MKNLTVAVDDKTYTRARVIAAKRGTSVSRLVTDYLSNIECGTDQHAAEWESLWRMIDQEQVEVGEKPSRSRTYADAGVP
ncbi:MAG: DUF6364 family protein [Gammaproteobacteria bacterium]|jgi:hypothetical protein